MNDQSAVVANTIYMLGIEEGLKRAARVVRDDASQEEDTNLYEYAMSLAFLIDGSLT